MVPTLLFDLSAIDLSNVIYDVDQIERVNPHRGAMRMLDGIVHESPDHREYVAFKDVRADEFWVPGHIPGRPVFPGVLMVEAAAQLASFMFLQRETGADFLGFSGIDDVKFRGQVKPGDRLMLLASEVERRPRRCICRAQGLVDGTMVFQGTITGMPM